MKSVSCASSAVCQTGRGWPAESFARWGSVQRSLLAGVADDPQLTVLGRAVARGEARPEALHPRVATMAVVLLRNEYVTRGIRFSPSRRA
jgi:hypothetical protein